MARSGSETTMPQSRAATRYLPPSATPQPANRLLAKPRHGRLRLPPARGGTRLGFLACCAPDFIARTIDLRRARAARPGPRAEWAKAVSGEQPAARTAWSCEETGLLQKPAPHPHLPGVPPRPVRAGAAGPGLPTRVIANPSTRRSHRVCPAPGEGHVRDRRQMRT